MDLRQLRSLVALAEERHFTRAAEREHLAQPALSQQIRRLEDELGVALVHRTTRRVSLSEAGTVLVERARRILAEVQAAEAEMADIAGLRTGRVTIGAMQTLGSFDLPLLLASFHERHPGVELAVREEPSDVLASMLRADALDLAFLSVTDRIEVHGLELRHLATEELVAVLPPGHRLAGSSQRLPLADLADEDFISFREGGALRDLLEGAAGSAGFVPRVAFESNEFPRVRSLVARGLGVALLPRSGVEGAGEEIAVRGLVDPIPTRDVTLAWRGDRRHAPAARAFLKLARS